jgi:hypothetical protein
LGVRDEGANAQTGEATREDTASSVLARANEMAESAVHLAVFAWEWTRVLAGTSWVADDRTVVADRLTRLTSLLAGALKAEPFAPAPGIEVGESLVGFGYVAPDALARTVTLLQERLLTDLRLDGTASPGIDGRLAQLVGAVSLGFTRALRNRTLDEQEAIRSSALLAWQRAEAALHEQTLHDPLTGLPNRAGFARDLEPMTAHVTTGTVTACLLVVTDLPSVDHVAGREAGDAVLRVLAERLRSHYRGPSEPENDVGEPEGQQRKSDRNGQRRLPPLAPPGFAVVHRFVEFAQQARSIRQA